MEHRHELVLVQRDGPVATVVLNRPEARNALNLALLEQLAQRLTELENVGELRALVVTGAGDRAFCAGADLIERQTMSAAERTAHTRKIDEVANALEVFPVPVVAAIEGFALAGGAEIAIACDLRVASSEASIGYPEVKVGVFPGAGGTVRLPGIVGAGVARDLLYTGRRIGADEALRLGLINRMTASGKALDGALALAREIAQNAPLAIRAVKRTLLESAAIADRPSHEIAARHRWPLDETEDYQEGIRAFAEKRVPRFTGR
jgi:enoyl-CoA hydratase/carnithine racemase